MPGKNPFIITYDLEEVASSGIPFMMEKIPGDTEGSIIRHAHRHDFYALGLAIKGTSTHMLDFERITIREKDMLLIVPGQVHQSVSEEKGSGWLIAFTAAFLAEHPIQLPLAPTDLVQLQDADFTQASAIIQMMHDEFRNRQLNYAKLIQHYLAVLITILNRNIIQQPDKQQCGPVLLTRFRELIAANYLQWTKPTQYASALHISADHLNEVVKQHTGQTASALITDRRILEAKRLLLHAKESIKEIAWHLQFNEISYFNRFFKQHTGYTPAAFRESVREKY